jgi:hypothetical protein
MVGKWRYMGTHSPFLRNTLALPYYNDHGHHQLMGWWGDGGTSPKPSFPRFSLWGRKSFGQNHFMDRERDTREYESSWQWQQYTTVAFVFCQPSLLPFSPFLGMTQWLTFPSVSCKVDRSSMVHNPIPRSGIRTRWPHWFNPIKLVRVCVWN